MRDFLPADVRRREYVIGVIKEVYERYGFEPLETPAVENIETLLGKYGEEGNQLIFKILKRGVHESTGEADLALRYDLTVPLARVVAEYRDKLPKFFKRYQIQPVWRADRPARGRFREFYQCDVDILGSRSMVVEAEICAAASEVLTKLGFDDFTIRLNHRNLLEGLLEHSMIPKDQRSSVLVVLDKLEKIGPDGVDSELAKRGVNAQSRELLLRFMQITQEFADAVTPFSLASWNIAVLNSLSQLIGDDIVGQHGMAELRQILSFTAATPASGRVKIDPTLARGLSYYTGAIMEIDVPGMPGSLGGGGRYDNLVGMFAGEDIPACGFSLGLERIIVVMEERGLFPRRLEAGLADVMVTSWDEGSVPDALRLASELRAEGLHVLFYPEVRKPSKQLFFADKQKIRSVIIVGPNELESGMFRVKDKLRGEHTLSRAEIASTLRKWFEEDAEALRIRNEGFTKVIEGND